MTANEIPAFGAANDDRGDFADSDGEDDIEECAKNIDRYSEGLYYPICIGEILSGRYRIIHKLGHGGFSTVWMAYDISLHKDVTLKIMIPGNSGEQEYHMHKNIAQAVSDTSSILLYEDTFIPHAPSDIQHRVLVLPLQGPNIRDSRFSKTPVKVRMSAAVQLLWALKSLHDGGIVHCDLNDANVLYRLSSLNNRLSTTEKYKLLGRPQMMPLQPKQWRPGELLLPMKPQRELIGSKVMLGDFGLAIEATTMRGTRFQSPAIFCAPERFHQKDPTFASDIWSYMCLFAELYIDMPLFRGVTHSAVITCIVNTLGPLPVSWREPYDAHDPRDDTWYDSQRLLHPWRDLEAVVNRLRPDVSLAERKLVLSILRWGLSYIPNCRPTARQILENDSFKALLEMYGVTV